jgi:EAL domain-containing protein (putative c-di-GMP-specific phosphodiesterase class I)
MDDFGTGYSSLSYLRSFPFDKIKIDQSFVRNMSEDESSLAIVRAVTGLSSSLGIVTTAEGVETIEQLESIRAEGCTEVQGFLVSAARPAGELATFIATAHKQSAVAA